MLWKITRYCKELLDNKEWEEHKLRVVFLFRLQLKMLKMPKVQERHRRTTRLKIRSE